MLRILESCDRNESEAVEPTAKREGGTHQLAELFEAAGGALDAECGLCVQKVDAVGPCVWPLLFNFGDHGADACARVGAGFCGHGVSGPGVAAQENVGPPVAVPQ